MNTFGSATQQFSLVDPRSIRHSRLRFRRDAIPALERANSFYCPSGRWPSRGWILLDRNSYNQLDKYSTTLQLNIGPGDSNSLQTIRNLSIVQAQCVTRGMVSDQYAIYLVELTDGRGLLDNRWFQCPGNQFFNIRAPAYQQGFYFDSISFPTTAYTWSTMLQNMWLGMTISGGLGPWPGLPITPTGTPEGFWFPSIAVWPAFNDVVEHLGMTIACDLTKANPFTIVVPGTTDAAFAAKATKYLLNKEDDLEWIDTGSGRVPSTVNVYFRRRNSSYGTEETIRPDKLIQWATNYNYVIPVAAPAMFANAAGTGYLWSDFTIRYDQDGNPLATDLVTANAIATERVTQYFNKIYRQTSGFMTRTYAGALPFATGSLIDGVCWEQDFNDRSEQGWKTQIVRGPSPPWPGIWDHLTY